jgi:predicted hotdog family 3-hydroxylacyl-ACP dehydratase
VLLSKAEIARLIPHGGPMCLLDGVVRWDASSIRCASRSHRDRDNPMRAGGQLPVVCGIEYAAQAMAVHGGLAGIVGAKPRSGYLVSVRDVAIGRSRLDDLAGELIVDAAKMMGDDSRIIYQFALRVGDLEILSGRATVVLDAGGGPA